MKKILLFLGVLLFSLVAVSCGGSEDDDQATVEVKGITVSSEENLRTIAVGDTLQLTAIVYPEGVSQEVIWTSKDASVAIVSETGLVTGTGVGTTSIVATSKENQNISNEFALIVEEAEEVVVNPTSVTVSSVSDSTTCKAGETIELTAIVLPREASQNVVWSSSDTTVATVSRGEVSTLKAGTVTITATAKGFDTVYGTITITVEAPDTPIVSGDWTSMPYSTHADYESGEADSKLKVKGIVTHVGEISEGKVSYFIQNGVDGYYVYNQDAILYPVEEGKVYEVGGYKKYYNGLNEIVNVEYCVELNESITYQYNSLEGKNPSSLDEMLPLQGSYVSSSGVFVSGQVNTTKAFNITLTVNGYETTLRVDPAYAGSEEFAKICEALQSLVAGVEVEFKGFMTAFGYGTPKVQIQVVNASDLVIAEASAEDILKACLDTLLIPTAVSFAKESIELPTTVSGFEGVTLVWQSSSDLIDVTTGAVTHTSKDEIVTLTVTLKLEETEITHEYQVKVEALDNTEHEVLVTLDVDDALDANKYGCSETKPGYAEAVVALGTPGYTWIFRNALIANSSSDKFEGRMSIRAKAGSDASSTARLEIQQAGEYNYVEFAGAAYGNHVLTSQVRIEYTFDDGATWLVADTIVTLASYELETFRIKLPEGVKRIAIVIVENSGKTVNLDSIKLMK